jgi:hypothetical protein
MSLRNNRRSRLVLRPTTGVQQAIADCDGDGHDAARKRAFHLSGTSTCIDRVVPPGMDGEVDKAHEAAGIVARGLTRGRHCTNSMPAPSIWHGWR